MQHQQGDHSVALELDYMMLSCSHCNNSAEAGYKHNPKLDMA